MGSPKPQPFDPLRRDASKAGCLDYNHLRSHTAPTVAEKEMIIGKRIRQLREQKGLSQEDIEERTGLLRCYVSRVENGHTVPSLEALERLASVLEIPLYEMFYEGDEPSVLPDLSKRQSTEELVMDEESEKEKRFLQVSMSTFEKALRLTSRIDEKDLRLVSVYLRPMLVLETKDGGEEGYLKKLYKPGSGPLWIIGMVAGTLLLALLGSILK